jgi:hypothetical protein
MTPRGDLDLIKAGLIERIGEVCRSLLPQGKDEGGLWVSFNPVENDFMPGRLPALKVRLRGGVVGAWKCWRCGEAGDVIKLVAYVMRTDTAGALVWGRDFLGLKAMSRADREKMRRVESTRRAEREKKDDAARARKLLNADRLFIAQASEKETGPALVPSGTFAWQEKPEYRHASQLHAEAYFAARNVPLDEIATLNRLSLRFSPQTEWWKGATYRHEGQRRYKTAPGALYPAVHSAMRNALGIVTCCHVTFLDPNRPAKAPVDNAKLMYGEALGAVIEISTGPGGKPFWQADGVDDRAHPVVLAEGIETALAFAVAGTPARVWACGSLAGIGHAPIHLPCVSWVLFARDNNDGNSQAQKQFSAALERLEASGKKIVVEASHVGDDFNDLAQGEE